jgi:hypothetical protein
VSKIALDETARATTRATSMPSLRLSGPIMTNHRVSSPAKHNNDQPQINTLNNNDNTHKDPKQNMSIVDITNGKYNFTNFFVYTLLNNWFYINIKTICILLYYWYIQYFKSFIL